MSEVVRSAKLFMIPLSHRKKQVMAASNLARFCAFQGIAHSAIDRLVDHLLEMLICPNLPEWEKSGAKLELCGRGDPIPESVLRALPVASVNAFSSLVESVVEVGIVDMYGETTGLPRQFLEESSRILRKSKIEPLSPTDLFSVEMLASENEAGWGMPLSEHDYTDVVLRFLKVNSIGQT